jgi:hypothetical protein
MHSTNSSIYGEIGVLPNRHKLVRARVCGTNLCANIIVDAISSSLKLILKVNKKGILFVKASHGRFHHILPKEYSGTFPELLWGAIKVDTY